MIAAVIPAAAAAAVWIPVGAAAAAAEIPVGVAADVTVAIVILAAAVGVPCCSPWCCCWDV